MYCLTEFTHHTATFIGSYSNFQKGIDVNKSVVINTAVCNMNVTCGGLIIPCSLRAANIRATYLCDSHI